MNYYNENDHFAAQWIRELIEAGLIPDGHVDERSITDVAATDLCGYTQHHFFCGIAGWPEALRLAGWPDERPIFTGSPPCQPFSSAGKRKGNADERHLWPELFRLIRECRPDVVFGEQVEGAIRHGWLDGIQADLEGEGYAVGHCVLGAHSVRAPHIRQRLYWVADLHGNRCDQGRECVSATRSDGAVGNGPACRLADAERDSRGPRRVGEQSGSGHATEGDGTPTEPGRCSDSCGLVQSGVSRLEGHGGNGDDGDQPGRDGAEPRGSAPATGTVGWLGDTASGGRGVGRDASLAGSGGHADVAGGPGGHWSDTRIIHCRDGKARRIPAETQPGVQPVASGISGGVVPGGLAGQIALFPLAGKVANRPGLLKGAGNAIVPAVAAEFIKAFMHATRKETPCD